MVTTPFIESSSGPAIAESLSAPDYLSLSTAARLCPGRPHAGSLWRWCRRGIRARSGERVRLQHVRVGVKVLTRREWLEAFWAALAQADLAHFDARDEAASNAPPREARYATPRRRAKAESLPPPDPRRAAQIEAAEREIAEAEVRP